MVIAYPQKRKVRAIKNEDVSETVRRTANVKCLGVAPVSPGHIEPVYLELDKLYMVMYSCFRFKDRHLLVAVGSFSAGRPRQREVTTDRKDNAAPTLPFPHQQFPPSCTQREIPKINLPRP